MQGIPGHGATSSESIVRHSSTVRRMRRGQISDVGEGEFARSARTRRAFACGRLNAGRIGDGIVERWNLCQYRVESVGHDTSPSCRDRSRQGPACERQSLTSRMSRPSYSSSARLRHRSCRGNFAMSVRLARLGSQDPAWRRSDKELPFPYCYGFLIRHSLFEASPTCTPPPICTLAPFPKPRWSEDRGRR